MKFYEKRTNLIHHPSWDCFARQMMNSLNKIYKKLKRVEESACTESTAFQNISPDVLALMALTTMMYRGF